MCLSLLLILLSALLPSPCLADSDGSFLEILPGQPVDDHNKYFLCYKPWVLQCSLVTVDWDTLLQGEGTVTLLGAPFHRTSSSSLQHGKNHHITLQQYQGPNPKDTLFLQVCESHGRRRLRLHAVMEGVKFLVANCGTDCHLLLTVGGG